MVVDVPKETKRLPRLPSKTGYNLSYRLTREDDFKSLILESLAHGASDIFIQPNTPICVSVNGDLYALTDSAMDAQDVQQILRWAAGRETAVTDVMRREPVNTRYEIFDAKLRDDRGNKLRHGYRVNAVGIMTQGAMGIQIVMRTIPNEVPTKEQVGISDELMQFCTPRDGIVYIAGKTSSGKSTTFAAILREIYVGDTPIRGNLVTCEEPVEFDFGLLRSPHSIIVQSQVPEMFATFSDALREGMRRAPGLFMIGELRDRETITAAVEASLTGHPVFGTVHASNVAMVIRRLISRFPPEQQSTAIYDIVDTARVIVAQRLVPSVTGQRVAAREYLNFTDDMREELGNLSDMGRVTQAVKQLVKEHGHSFAKEGERLFNEGVISEKVMASLQHA